MKFSTAALACVVFIVGNVGITIGLVGSECEAYVIGWDHVVLMLLFTVAPTVCGYIAGWEGSAK